MEVVVTDRFHCLLLNLRVLVFHEQGFQHQHHLNYFFLKTKFSMITVKKANTQVMQLIMDMTQKGFCLAIQFSLKFVPVGPIDTKAALVWLRTEHVTGHYPNHWWFCHFVVESVFYHNHCCTTSNVILYFTKLQWNHTVPIQTWCTYTNRWLSARLQ